MKVCQKVHFLSIAIYINSTLFSTKLYIQKRLIITEIVEKDKCISYNIIKIYLYQKVYLLIVL